MSIEERLEYFKNNGMNSSVTSIYLHPITILDTGTQIDNVLVAKISPYPRWLIYDPMKHCCFIFGPYPGMQIQSFNDITDILQSQNYLIDVNSWQSSTAGTMIAFFYYLANFNSDSLPPIIDVEPLRKQLIKKEIRE